MSKYNIGDKVLFDLNSGQLKVKPIFVNATIKDIIDRPYNYKDVYKNNVEDITKVPLKDIECVKCHKRKIIFEPFDQNYYNV